MANWKQMRKELTQEKLKGLLDYDPVTGVFRWRVRPCNAIHIGDIAGRVSRAGYRIITIETAGYSAPRLAWLYVNGEWPKSLLRFENGDPDDCRIENLRDTHGDTLGLRYREHVPENAHPELLEKHKDGKRAYYRNWSLKKNFGIDLLEYQRMFVAQEGKCAICGNEEGGEYKGRQKWLAVDHDHETGAVRELLCECCNKTLGLMGDDPVRLRSAARYIESHRAKDGASNVVHLVTKEASDG